MLKNSDEKIRPVKIGRHIVGPGHPVYIVAELSANHRQDYDEAVRLIHAAKEAGADAVKLQTYTPDTMTVDCGDDSFKHGRDSLWDGQTLYNLYQKAFMPWEWQPKLKKIAMDIGIDFFSSAYDPTSVDFLDEMDVPAFKISSFELVDLPLIQYAAQTGKPVIISTGMATIEEIDAAIETAKNAGAKEIVLLKCTSAYPTDSKEMNLRTIADLAGRFHLPVGLSDHSCDNLAAVAATAIGAVMVEKHFTMSRQNGSADCGFSMEPDEFKAMVNSVRTTENAMGKLVYGPAETEKESLSFRRSLYAVASITAGESFTASNVRSIRPAGGIAPIHMERLLGRSASRNILAGTPIVWGDVEEE